MRNPVMFVTEVGSVLTTVLWIQALLGHGEAPCGLYRRGRPMVVVCVLFANFSEALAEGRGKAQAAACVRHVKDTQAKNVSSPTKYSGTI